MAGCVTRPKSICCMQPLPERVRKDPDLLEELVTWAYWLAADSCEAELWSSEEARSEHWALSKRYQLLFPVCWLCKHGMALFIEVCIWRWTQCNSDLQWQEKFLQNLVWILMGWGGWSLWCWFLWSFCFIAPCSVYWWHSKADWFPSHSNLLLVWSSLEWPYSSPCHGC